jgi:hypothetical protein
MITVEQANKHAAAEMNRRGLVPDLDDTGRVRGAITPGGGYRKIEVVPVEDGVGHFGGAPRQDVDVFVFTDGETFWITTADEVRS